MDFGTFSELAMDFSEGEMGSFGGFVLILFRASDGNRIVCLSLCERAVIDRHLLTVPFR
jgi:hypothetical protein